MRQRIKASRVHTELNGNTTFCATSIAKHSENRNHPNGIEASCKGSKVQLIAARASTIKAVQKLLTKLFCDTHVLLGMVLSKPEIMPLSALCM